MFRSPRTPRGVGRPRATRAVSAVLGLALAAGLSACANDPVAQQYLDGDSKGYIGSAGLRVDEITPDERKDPVDFGGTLDSGEAFDSTEVAGDVVVVNFWYATCGPCRVEAADLESVWQEFADQDVSFVGVNTYDQADTARSFAEKYGVTYPSIIDVNTGDAKLAFAQATTIQATPTTLVLDKQGRVAARIVGQLEEPSILSTLIKDALAETA
ncbi:TlpA disulfide reductase family protein [Microbacterium pseudoresistens]|uniref:Peroxiredoxin n=1 Tax=Microbacterium pseudoresistens TaxID=640634 RepID=A0A7Y9ETA7_9MICO|nr:peroxiredoxin [Microbacterium pseudoresistens]